MTTATAINFAAARKAMIDSQLRTSGVNDLFVLQRMMDVPREDFLPAASRDVAYMDRSVPLANGAKLPPPLFHGMMLAEAKPTLADKVLVVDSGAGYVPALFAPLVASVTTVAPDQATKALRKGKGASLLLIDGAVEALPASLIKVLADDARVVTGLFDEGVTRMAVGRKTGKDVAFLSVLEIGIPKLAAFDRPQGFTF